MVIWNNKREAFNSVGNLVIPRNYDRRKISVNLNVNINRTPHLICLRVCLFVCVCFLEGGGVQGAYILITHRLCLYKSSFMTVHQLG